MELSVRVLVADSQTLRANDTVDEKLKNCKSSRNASYRWSIREKDERGRNKIAISGKLNVANG